MKISTKISIISFIIAIAFAFSYYEKSKIDSYFTESEAPVLKNLPEGLALVDFSTNSPISLNEVIVGTQGLIVHFWGTWCAPCEYELPDFLVLSKKLESQNIKVVLLAVNDDDVKIKKFMKRFGELSKNIILIHDKNGESMKNFGVVKVPETFLFNDQKVNLIKFSGPQNWKLDSYFNRILNYLSN